MSDNIQKAKERYSATNTNPLKPSEYELFRNYGIVVKRFILDHAYLSRYPEAENTNVAYASPPRAFAKYLVPVLNGSNLNPTVTFYLSNMEYAQGENLLGFQREKVRISATKYKHIPPMLVYKLTYKVTIMVANELDADIIQYELIASAPFSQPYATKIGNQWVTIYANNASNDTNIEPGDVQDKISRRSVDLVIPRAYLPRDFSMTENVVGSLQVSYETDSTL